MARVGPWGRLLPSPREDERVIICKKCGNRNQDQDQFCASCGSFLEWSGERVEAAPPPPEPEPQPAPPPPPPPPRPGPPPPPPIGFVGRVKQAVGIEEPGTPGPAPSPPPPVPTTAAGGGWVPPASVASTQTATPAPPVPTPAPPVPQPQPPTPAPPRPVVESSQPVITPPPPTPPPPRPAVMPQPVPPRPPTPAGPGAIVPEAMAPTQQRARPAPVTAPPVFEVQESGIYCSRCGTGNDLRRHFCRRCGAPLAQAAPTRVPWYRRLFPSRQPAMAGDRHAPTRPVSAGSLIRSFLATLLIVLVAGGALAYALVPNFRQAVNTRVDTTATQVRRLFGAGLVEVHPVTTRGSSELTGHPARFAGDLINNDYWAADVARDPQPTLVFTFDGKTDLDYLLVTTGATAADYARLARPRTIQLVYSDGTGETLTLQDDPKPTQYSVHARQVGSVAMRVTSVYPTGGSTSVAITEVEFYHLK